jgi:transcriptional regulator with XRE-family HTH domain
MKATTNFSPEETWAWLRARMDKLSINSLDELSQVCGINKGTLSRYFHQKQRPTVDVLVPLCEALQVSPKTLLSALGVFPRL